MQKFYLVLIAFCLCTTSIAQNNDSSKLKTLGWKDVATFRYIQTFQTTISPDGKWVAYPLVAVEDDGVLVLKKVNDTTKKTFKIGGATTGNFAFSEDGKWFVYKEGPTTKEKKAAEKTPGKQMFEKLYLYDLSKDTIVQTFEKAASYSFNGKASSVLAIQIAKERAPGAKDETGSDLFLHQLSTNKTISLGDVGEFKFSKDGNLLLYSKEVANKAGNGLYLYNLNNRQITLIDNDKTTYKSLNWFEDKDAIAALKMTKDEKFKTDKGAVVAAKNLRTTPAVYVYDPIKDSLNFPAKMTISGNRSPRWSDDLSRVFFGINTLEAVKKELETKDSAKPKTPVADTNALEKIRTDTSIKTIADLKKAIEKADPKPTASVPPKKEDVTKPDMTIWHWQDRRLQSRQQVMEMADRNFSYLASFTAGPNKFVQYNDSTLRNITLFPKSNYALASDISQYELEQNLSGQNYSDIYIVDVKTGKKTPFRTNFYMPSWSSAPKSSPDGRKFVYGDDGNYFVYDIPSAKTKNITSSLPTSFIDVEDDHNIQKPLTTFFDWSSDSRFVLINDGWDVWQIDVNTGRYENLTKNGKKDKIRYEYRYVLDDEEKGYDWKKPQYIRTYGEWNKKSGYAILAPGNNGLKAGVQNAVWGDHSVGQLRKAKYANSLLYSKGTFSTPVESYVTDAAFKNANQVTANSPDIKKYAWSNGVRLVNYVSDKGDSLQGALFLPANYEAGKKYPTIVYYYEKLSQTLHEFSTPTYSGGGWNPGMYTANGYAVFIPDIVYKIDDPGMSAVWCVLPGVKEAIKTGVIDENKMGITGHSWGGYQTSFLITQTNMFKAAAAGAPLTDLVSMYNLIYWNSGGGNMSIFEASQGRFRGGPWENWEAYNRNSPIYHVKKVNTPLLLLHNDKDGAVDFTQGVEYYNALRRLRKPVVMLQYKGENHGLAKLENRKDYAVRMMEFFDHYLKGKPAPDWWDKGVDRLKLADHLEERAF